MTARKPLKKKLKLQEGAEAGEGGEEGREEEQERSNSDRSLVESTFSAISGTSGGSNFTEAKSRKRTRHLELKFQQDEVHGGDGSRDRLMEGGSASKEESKTDEKEEKVNEETESHSPRRMEEEVKSKRV